MPRSPATSDGTQRAEVLPSARPEDPVVAPVRRRPAWETRYVGALVVLDTAAIGIGLAGAWIVAPPEPETSGLRGIGPVASSFALAVLWITTLWSSGGYDMRLLNVGSEEYRRVVYGAAKVLAIVAVAAFFTDVDVSAGFAALFLGIGLAVQLLGRRVARRRLHHLRADGRCTRRVLVIGAAREVNELIAHLETAPYAGLGVVAACVPTNDSTATVTVPLVGHVSDPIGAIASAGVDAVVIADSHTLGSAALRRLAWQLEGTGTELIVAPAVTHVAGPRIVVRPIAGLPLLHVDEPELTGAQRLAKEIFDRTAAAVLLVLFAPLFVILALTILVDSRGPILYRQVRVGRDGAPFTMLKFRTMVPDADEQLVDLADDNDADGPLFKMRADPRVTRTGRFFRRHSLDELPQLLNVLVGHMSIVGPRPPLPSEVQRYGSDEHRRLVVKPGMSGLWQVSGRSELTWDESVRLDLYYVENWSPALDAQILWRTLGVVIRGRGAY